MPRTSSTRRRRTVPRNEQQIFQFGSLAFDVEKAHQLLRSSPRPRCRLPVDAWARLYGLDDNPASLITPGPAFDRAYAMTVDVTRPVVLALLKADDMLGNPILIDGCHRLYKAHRLGLSDLPAYQLTLAETRAIRIQ